MRARYYDRDGHPVSQERRQALGRQPGYSRVGYTDGTSRRAGIHRFQALTARVEFHSTPRFRRSGYSSSTALYRSSAVSVFSAAAAKARR